MYNVPMKVILASQSPRRKELLAKIVADFQVVPSSCEEVSAQSDPKLYVCELATQKSTDVWQRNADALVIGSDTVVELDGVILGKPKSQREATETLRNLSGKTHNVHTGVCILYGQNKHVFVQTTAVTFKKLSEEEISRYVQSGAPMDKAGAYGIQECGFVESFVGSYDNVVGFPTEQVAKIIEKYKG